MCYANSNVKSTAKISKVQYYKTQMFQKIVKFQKHKGCAKSQFRKYKGHYKLKSTKVILSIVANNND